MATAKLFPLAVTGAEVSVELRVRALGETYRLVHVFREPTVEDRRAYWGWLSRRGENAAGDPAADYLAANETLYDSCILRVEGYDFTRTAGQEQDRPWKKAVPFEHKLWAVEKLLERAGVLSEEEAKN